MMPGNGTSQKQREILGKYNGLPFTVLGTYSAYSRGRCEFCHDTILLKNVTDENRYPLCDHLWMKAPKYVPDGIRVGDHIRVNGRITDYMRLDGSLDYTLFIFNMKKGVAD